MLRPQTGDKTTLARRVFRHSQTAHPGQAQRVAPSLFTSMEVTPNPARPRARLVRKRDALRTLPLP